VVGVIQKVGLEVGKQVISIRRRARELVTYLGGKIIHPVMGLPGGVAKGIAPEELPKFKELAKDALGFARFTLQVFHDLVLKNEDYVKMILSDAYTHKTYYMGLVDQNNKVNFYDGLLRVVTPDGKEFAKFPVQKYLDHIAEHTEPWSYIKFCFLKSVGWNGFAEGSKSGVYAVAPLARLNAAEGMATPEAQAAYEEYLKVLGGKPVHQTLANHWARCIEILYAAERINELVNDPEITSQSIRVLPTAVPKVGVGVVEAPRGTLIHHFETDDRGILTKVNLIVATQNNAARIAMSVEKAAKNLIHKGVVTEGLLNKVEMAFRAYDPCHGCATHALPGQMPLVARIFDVSGQLVQEIRQ
jgi:F420-non-reducing hydrogenase large subunit